MIWALLGEPKFGDTVRIHWARWTNKSSPQIGVYLRNNANGQYVIDVGNRLVHLDRHGDLEILTK